MTKRKLNEKKKFLIRQAQTQVLTQYPSCIDNTKSQFLKLENICNLHVRQEKPKKAKIKNEKNANKWQIIFLSLVVIIACESRRPNKSKFKMHMVYFPMQ